MAKVSTYLFLILTVCIIVTGIVQLFSTNDTTDFYSLMDTIIKVALGAWGGASITEEAIINKQGKKKK